MFVRLERCSLSLVFFILFLQFSFLVTLIIYVFVYWQVEQAQNEKPEARKKPHITPALSGEFIQYYFGGWVFCVCVCVCARVPAYVCLCGGWVLACMCICKCTYEFSRWQILKDRNMCQAWWLSPDFLGKAYQDFVQICKIKDVCQNCASLGILDLVSGQKCS